MTRALALALIAGCASSASGVPDVDGGGGGDPDGAPGTGDGFPAGAISFFLDTQCPSGWEVFGDGIGRTIVPSAGGDAGALVGAPLGANEPRAHAHPLEVSVDLPSVSYAGVAGEANHGVAQGGAASSTTALDGASGTPPYAQLLVCEKTAPSGSGTPPSGVIAFFATAACPAGWLGVDPSLFGRVLVGLPEGGTHAATFGGPPLAAGESRTHSHDVTATVAGGSHGIALVSGCCAGGYGAAGDRAASATAEPASVELPYVQLLACAAP